MFLARTAVEVEDSRTTSETVNHVPLSAKNASQLASAHLVQVDTTSTEKTVSRPSVNFSP